MKSQNFDGFRFHSIVRCLSQILDMLFLVAVLEFICLFLSLLILEFLIERGDENGGNLAFTDFDSLEKTFANKV